jgi:hypothetical protein
MSDDLIRFHYVPSANKWGVLLTDLQRAAATHPRPDIYDAIVRSLNGNSSIKARLGDDGVYAEDRASVVTMAYASTVLKSFPATGFERLCRPDVGGCGCILPLTEFSKSKPTSLNCKTCDNAAQRAVRAAKAAGTSLPKTSKAQAKAAAAEALAKVDVLAGVELLDQPDPTRLLSFPIRAEYGEFYAEPDVKKFVPDFKIDGRKTKTLKCRVDDCEYVLDPDGLVSMLPALDVQLIRNDLPYDRKCGDCGLIRELERFQFLNKFGGVCTQPACHECSPRVDAEPVEPAPERTCATCGNSWPTNRFYGASADCRVCTLDAAKEKKDANIGQPRRLCKGCNVAKLEMDFPSDDHKNCTSCQGKAGRNDARPTSAYTSGSGSEAYTI